MQAKQNEQQRQSGQPAYNQMLAKLYGKGRMIKQECCQLGTVVPNSLTEMLEHQSERHHHQRGDSARNNGFLEQG